MGFLIWAIGVPMLIGCVMLIVLQQRVKKLRRHTFGSRPGRRSDNGMAYQNTGDSGRPSADKDARRADDGSPTGGDGGGGD